MLEEREAERTTMQRTVERASSGSTTLVVVEGEAGIGKTALTGQALALALSLGFNVREGHCSEIGAHLPFAAILDAFGIHESEPSKLVPSELVPSELEPRVSERFQNNVLREEINKLLREVPDFRSPVMIAVAPDIRTRIVDSLCALTESEALAHPMALVIEDLQWSDPSTILALQSIVRRVEGYRLLVIATWRSAGSLSSELSALTKMASSVVRLGPLDTDALNRLVRQQLNGEPGPRLRHLLSGLGGNPLVTKEILESVRSRLEHRDGAIDVIGEMPTTLGANTVLRVGALSPGAAELVHAASVMPGAIDLPTLSVLLTLPVVRLVPVVREVVAAGIFIDNGESASFRHDLIRKAVYESLPSSVRRMIHRDVANSLIRNDAPPSLVAAHLDLARSSSDDPAELRRWLLRAARGALNRAPSIAHALYDRAKATLPPEDSEQIEIAVEQLEAAVNAGLLHEGVELGSLLINGVLSDSQALRVRWWLGGALFLSQRAEEAALLFILAVNTAPIVEVRALMLGYATLARMSTFSPDADELIKQAVSLAEESGDTHSRTLVYGLQSRSLATRLQLRSSLDPALRAVAVADADQVGHRYQPLFMLALAELDNCRFDQARESSRRGRREAANVGAVWSEVLFHSFDALLAYYNGDNETAEVEAAAGIAFAEETGSEISVLWCHGVIALLALDRGDLDRAEASIQRGEKAFEAGYSKMGLDLLVLARAQIDALVNERAACTYLADAFDLFGLLEFPISQERLAITLADLAVRCNDDALLLRILDCVRQWVLIDKAPTRINIVHEAVEAIAKNDVDCIQKTVMLARNYGMESDARQLEKLVNRLIGLTVSMVTAPVCLPQGGWTALTPAEKSVCRLIAHGQSNKRIGTTLGISIRTVETHVTHILKKFDVTSRLELAIQVVADNEESLN
jgi:DNA-binding CsgD family transcriptional regulator